MSHKANDTFYETLAELETKLYKISCIGCALTYNYKNKTYKTNKNAFKEVKAFGDGGEVFDYIVGRDCPKCGQRMLAAQVMNETEEKEYLEDVATSAQGY